jgi:hypothetical protein
VPPEIGGLLALKPKSPLRRPTRPSNLAVRLRLPAGAPQPRDTGSGFRRCESNRVVVRGRLRAVAAALAGAWARQKNTPPPPPIWAPPETTRPVI